MIVEIIVEVEVDLEVIGDYIVWDNFVCVVSFVCEFGCSCMDLVDFFEVWLVIL